MRGGEVPDQAKAMTLIELLGKLEEATPFIDDKVEWILRNYPELAAPPGIQLGRLVGIALMDFLCGAFDRPDLGYLPPNARDC